MPIAHLRPGRTLTPSSKQKAGRSFTAPLAALAAVATVAAIALSLLGYGVTLAVESTFGVPHAQVFASSTDLLSLSTWVVVEIFNMPIHDLVSPMLNDILLSAALLAVFSMGVWVFVARKDLWPGLRWCGLRKKRGREKLRPVLIWLAPVAGLFGAGLIFVFYTAIVVGLYVVITFVAALPTIGMTTAERFLQQNVVAPLHCVPPQSRENLMKRFEAKQRSLDERKHVERAASCVQVTRDGKLLAKGRVAISTTCYVVLFDPSSGEVLRVPTREAIVQPVSSL